MLKGEASKLPFKPRYFAVGNRCIRNPVGSSKNKYVT